MKKLFLFFFTVLTCASAISQIDTVTYGISVKTQDSELYLSKISVSDGNVEKISSNPAIMVPGGYGRTIDPFHHIFYYLPGTDLLAFDLHSGELIRKVTITNLLQSTFHGINYNYRDSTLYGIAVNAAGMSVKLATLNPYTGLVTPVSDTSLASSYNVLTGTALDPVRGIFYFETIKNPSNHLIGADLYSGDLISDVPIGIDPEDRFGPMEYNCHDSTLYGLTGNYQHGRKLASIDPDNGTVTVLSKLIVADTILNEPVTIDPFKKILYFESSDRTFRGADLISGDLVAYSIIIPLPETYFTGFLFNHACYFHSPSFIGNNKKQELTIFPNPVLDKLTIRSSIPLFKIEILDFTGRSVLTEKYPRLNEIQLDLASFQEGIYIIRINEENANMQVKFIKTANDSQHGH